MEVKCLEMLIFQLYCIWFHSLWLRQLYVDETSGMFFLVLPSCAKKVVY